MNDEQKAWGKQYTSNIGAKEILKSGCAVIVWLFFGVAASIVFEIAGYSLLSSIIFGLFFVALFAFALLAPRRKRTYLLLRRILGNDNLPHEPFPGPIKISHEPRPWGIYILGIWHWLLILLILFIILKWYFQ